jgi:DHA1 family inner membrane transport protein
VSSPSSTDRPTLPTGRVVAAVVALALGGFAIGTTEFVTMGVLPDIAGGVGIDIPTAASSSGRRSSRRSVPGCRAGRCSSA